MLTNKDRLAELVRERDKIAARLVDMKAMLKEQVDELKHQPLKGMNEPYNVCVKAHKAAIESLDAEISRCAASPDQCDHGLAVAEGGQ